MGQAVAVANASGDRLYVKAVSSVQFSGKTHLTASGKTPATRAEATVKVDVEVDGKPLHPGYVAIDNGQSLKFARSKFGRRLLTVKKGPFSEDQKVKAHGSEDQKGKAHGSEDQKVVICHHFLVPYCTNIIVTPNNTIRYAKIGHKWVDIDGDRYRPRERQSSASSGQTHSTQTQ